MVLPTDYAANDAGHVDAHNATDTQVNANTALLATALQAGANLSDLDDATAARTALGLGDVATHAADEFAPLASPALTGTPTAPTPPANDNSTRIATTAYVDAGIAGSASETVSFSATTATVGASVGYQLQSSGTITTARMACTGAPAGSDLVVAVQLSTDGGTTWTTISTLTIPAGSTAAVTASPSRAVSAGDLVRVNATSVGSTTAAANVLVQVVST